MTIQLFMLPMSPPVQAVQITAKVLGIDLELKLIDVYKGENKNPEFLKMNPQGTIPVLNDNGTILWDSHAINAYLVSKYGKNDSLYPKDPVKRAIVDQRLHFDSSVIFPLMRAALRPKFLGIKSALDQADIDSFNEVYEFLEKFLEDKKWIAGDSITIADYTIYTTIFIVQLNLPINDSTFPKLSSWYHKVDYLPESEIAKQGLKFAREMSKNLKK